jgi:outer membrane protein W
MPASVKIGDDVAFGAVLGLDIDFSNSDWFFTSSLKYLDASYDAQVFDARSPQEIDFDPLIVRAGLGYRF